MTGKERVAREAVKEVKNHMILGFLLLMSMNF